MKNDWNEGEGAPSITGGLITIGIIGGVMFLAQKLTEDGGPPRRSSSKQVKGKKSLSAKITDSINKIPSKKLAEIPTYQIPTEVKSSMAEPSKPEGKWPLEYYTLSKGQQYKFRQRIRKDLTSNR